MPQGIVLIHGSIIVINPLLQSNQFPIDKIKQWMSSVTGKCHITQLK